MEPLFDALKFRFQIPIAPDKSVERSVHCFIVYGEDICVIDSGVKGSESMIFEAIEARGRDPTEISALVHTHAHPDHIGSSAMVERKTGCEVMIHFSEVMWLQDPKLQCRERPVPGFEALVSEGVMVGRELKEGDRIDLGGAEALKVIHTPGHSPGSICLWHEGSGTLFSGDAVPLAKDLPIYDDAVSSMGSLRKISELKDMNSLCAAWDDPVQGEDARMRIGEGMSVISRVHDLVREQLAQDASMGREELCRRCVSELGLLPQLANPLLARTFEAHRRALMSGFHHLP